MIAAPGAVILRLLIIIIHADELFSPRPVLHQQRHAVVMAHIGFSAGGRNADDGGIGRRLHNHEKRRRNRDRPGSSSAFCRIEQDGVKKQQGQGQVKYPEFKGIIGHQLLAEQHEGRSARKGRTDVSDWHGAQMTVGLVAHQQEDKDVDEGLSGRKTVGIMESVPDKIQEVDAEAGQEEHFQRAVNQFFLPRNSPVQKIKYEKDINSRTAVDVRPVVQACLRFHAAHVAGEHVNDGEVALKGLREGGLRRGRLCERHDLRKEDDSRQGSRKEGKQRKQDDLFSEFFSVLIIQETNDGKIDHQEDADHDGDIVVGENGKPQGNAVEIRLSFPDHNLQSQHNQRKEPDTVQPHDIPAVGSHEAGQGIECAEEPGAQPHTLRVALQIPGKGKSRQSGFDHHHGGHKFYHMIMGTEEHQPVEGARQIVGVKGHKIGAQSDVPAVQETSSGTQLVPEFLHEGGILMVHVQPEITFVPEGPDAAGRKYHHQHNDRYKKSEKQTVRRAK